MGTWLLGLWNVLSAILGVMLDVAQFWHEVSVPVSQSGGGRVRPAGKEPPASG